MSVKQKKLVTYFSVLVLITITLFFAGNFLYASIKQPAKIQKLTASTLYPTPKPIGHFELINKQSGLLNNFSEKQLKGQWHLIFMGYTNCPHICPTEMKNLSDLYKLLPPELQKETQVVMVTTDPLKDSPEVLEEYVKKFHSDFIGLSGNKIQISEFAKQFSMPFLPSEETDKNKTYEVNHSGSIYLTNPQGELHAVFSTPHDINHMQSDLLKIIKL